MADYGSVAGAHSYVRHITLDTSNNPTTTQVVAWLEQRCAILNGWLAVAGYTTPVTAAAAVAALDYYANVGTAADMELSQRAAGYSSEDTNRRETLFLSEFAKAETWINSGALAGLGVTATVTGGALQFVTATYGGANTPDEFATT